MLSNPTYSLINSTVRGVSILGPGLKVFECVQLQLVLSGIGQNLRASIL